MSTLAQWMPSVLLFGGAFFAASLVSGVVYWVARLSSPEMHCLKITSSFFVCFLIVVFSGSFPGGVEALVPCALIIIGMSAIQAGFERGITSNKRATNDFVRALFSYICSIFIGELIFFAVAPQISFRWAGQSGFYFALFGFMAGLVLTPISLSFYRWAFQSLALRPGIDRALREDEMTMP